MPDDTTEGVAEQNNYQLACPRYTSFVFSCSGTDVYSPKGKKARVSLVVQSIKPHSGTHSGIEPGTSGSTVQSSNHYTTTVQ